MYTILSNGTKEYVEVRQYNEPIVVPGKFLKKESKASQKMQYTKGVHAEYVLSEPAFADTETSHIGAEFGWVHQWAVKWGNIYYVGRTARQLGEWIARAAEAAHAIPIDKVNADKKKTTVVIYVHNLAYDWCYIREYLPPHEIFAVKSHKVLTARGEGWELRCSYILTNNALKKWAENSKAAHRKLEDTYDYSRVLLPTSPLSCEDWAYQLNDVAAMYDSFHFDRSHDNYDMTNIPLTSTGFIRNEVKELATESTWKAWVERTTPDYEWYCIMVKAYQAGVTHGNRFKGDVIESPVGHRDFTSSFPARMVMDKFPCSEWQDFDGTLEEVEETYEEFAYLLVLRLTDMKLKTPRITAPILSKSHLENVSCSVDNGRVLAFKGSTEYCVTEMDYLLLKRQYDGGIAIVKAKRSRKELLPKPYRDLIMYYFRNKCRLDPRINPDSDEVLYMKSKNVINGIYGDTVTKTVQPLQKYNCNTMEWSKEEASYEEYDKRKKKLHIPFHVGVWVVTYARWALYEAIEAVGYDNFLYCDTDSIFYLMTPETEKAMERFDKECKRRAKKAGAYCGKKYLGAFGMEDDAPIQKFKQLHAKCYAFIDNKGKLKVTIAGVNKKRTRFVNGEKVTITNAEELGSIYELKDGFKFKECGGSACTYVNMTPHFETVMGEQVEVASAAIITDSEYKVNDTRAKGELEDIESIIDWIDGGVNYEYY